MARLTSYVQINFAEIDLNWYRRFETEADVEIGVNAVFSGVTYPDLIYAIGKEGSEIAELDLGGYGITSDGTAITGGRITGLIEQNYQTNAYYLEGIDVSAVAVFNAYLTRSNADDLAILAEALAGDDEFRLSDFGDSVSGYDGNDRIYGYGGNDTIDGGRGADFIDGGTGVDTMRGGPGSDIYVVDQAGDLVIENSGEGTDEVRALISYVLPANVEILALYAIGATPINGTGNSLDNLITGTVGNNVLDGREGNDVLSSGDGEDTLIGGAGDDVFLVYSAGKTIIEFAGQRTDRVSSAISFTLPGHVENLILIRDAVINGTGNDLDNEVTGNMQSNVLSGADGNDTLSGLDGDDTLDGGRGRDRLFGGNGNDSYGVDDLGDLVFEGPGGGIDIVVASASHYLFAEVENLTLASGAGDIFGVGNGLDNIIIGNAGSNLLIAGAGDDVVEGGAGVDTLFGEAGADTMHGGAENDYLAGGIGDDILDGGNGGDSLYGEDGDDTLLGGGDFVFDLLVGGAGDDTLRGDSGFGDFDYLYGNAGNDVFYVDTPFDLVFEQPGDGFDTVYATIDGAGYYLYENIENLVLLGSTPFGVGNAMGNTLTGNDIGNFLLGGGGNDSLNGKGGNDVLFGESGIDYFVFERGTGGDVIGDFEVGVDKIVLTGIGFADFDAVKAAFVENGGTTAIDLGLGDLVVVFGVANAMLSASDFILG